MDKRHKKAQFVKTLRQALESVKYDIKEHLNVDGSNYRRIVITHNSPYKDDVVSYAYELRELYKNMGVFVRHKSNRQSGYVGLHIGVAMI
jgi:hypothetical protein